MSLIRLQVLGPFKAELADGVDISPRSKKARALLGILALSPSEGVSRGRLASLLWDRVDPEQARNLLRGALHEVRTSFEPVGHEIVQATRDHVSLRRNHVQIDVDDILASDDRRAGSLGADVAERLILDGLEHTARSFDEWLTATRLTFKERLGAVLARQAQAELPQPSRGEAGEAMTATASSEQVQPRSRRGRSGIRIGVAPIRTFSAGDSATAFALAHELSAALSEFRWISVPAPDAVAAALGSDRNTQTAFTALDLDFLLDGQLQMTGGKLRLRTSLVSAYEAAIVWTFKTERENTELVSSHDEIAAEVAARIDSHLLSSESQRIGSSAVSAQDAYGLVMRAIRTACSLDPETFASAGDLLAEAVRLEPGRPMAHISTALFYLIAASQGWVTDPRTAMQRAESEANTALSMDSSEAQAWAIAGYVRSVLHQQPEEAVALLRRSIAVNPNLPLAWHFSAGTYLLLGDMAQARTCIARYEQLGPTGVHFFGNSALITLNMLEGNYEEAVRVGRTTVRMHPNFVAAYKPLLAALGHLGRLDEAAAAHAELLRLEPNFTPTGFLRTVALRRAEDRDRYETGLLRGCAAGCEAPR